jgi:hypothetical protein
MDLKMKYGDFKKQNGDIEEFMIVKPKDKFVTFKTSMCDAEFNIHD